MPDKKIVDYTVVASTKLEVLVHDVDEFITSGWAPYGSFVCQSDRPQCLYYFQPMVKYEE